MRSHSELGLVSMEVVAFEWSLVLSKTVDWVCNCFQIDADSSIHHHFVVQVA